MYSFLDSLSFNRGSSPSFMSWTMLSHLFNSTCFIMPTEKHAITSPLLYLSFFTVISGVGDSGLRCLGFLPEIFENTSGSFSILVIWQKMTRCERSRCWDWPLFFDWSCAAGCSVCREGHWSTVPIIPSADTVTWVAEVVMTSPRGGNKVWAGGGAQTDLIKKSSNVFTASKNSILPPDSSECKGAAGASLPGWCAHESG